MWAAHRWDASRGISWMSKLIESDGASFLLHSQITVVRNVWQHRHLHCYLSIIRLSLCLPFPLSALSPCVLLLFVSFRLVTKAVEDCLQAVFLALIMHRCGWCGKGIFVQGIPGVTQIDGDLWESSLLWGNWGHLWQGGGSQEGARGQIEGRRGRRGEAGHWRPATGSHLKNDRGWQRLAFIRGWGEEQRDDHYTTFAYTHMCVHTYRFTQLSESANLSSNLCKLKVWPEKAFMCSMCDEEACGRVGCCLN